VVRIVPLRRYWQFLFHRATHVLRAAIGEEDRPRERERSDSLRSRVHLFFFQDFRNGWLVSPFFLSLPASLFSALNRAEIAFYRIHGYRDIQIDLSYWCTCVLRRFSAWKRIVVANSLVVRTITMLVPSLSLFAMIKCTQFRYVLGKKSW